MLLAIDIGNSRIKAAVFDSTSLLQHFVFTPTEAEIEFQNIFKSYPRISNIIQSRVGHANVMQYFPADIKIHEVDRNWKMPFKNDYQTPQTLGIDRMILTAGAVLQYPKMNRIIIDAGTCITYDYCDEFDVYGGGAISPGLNLRYNSLHDFTAKLPKLSPHFPTNMIGRSTEDAIHSGVVNGTLFEIEGFISLYAESQSNFIIILTGGDAVFLADRLKNTIFANSNFLLESLNYIFHYNIKND